HAHGVHVEAEIGTLGGIEDLGEKEARTLLTDPDQAVRFAQETAVDALAIAIGTSHRAYKFKRTPHLDLHRLKEIARRIPPPRAASRGPACARAGPGCRGGGPRSPRVRGPACRTRRASRRSSSGRPSRSVSPRSIPTRTCGWPPSAACARC